jgi:small-conductance mechanosensitive channel
LIWISFDSHGSKNRDMKKYRITLIFTCLYFAIQMCIPLFVNAQQTADVDPELEGVKLNRAPVIVDGKTLFTVRGVLSHPAELRAASIAKRIQDAASNPSVSADSVKIKEEAERLKIYAGDVFIINIYPEDGTAEDINFKVLAEVMQAKIKKAIEDHREARSQPVLIKKMFYAIGALIILILMIFLLLWLFRKGRIFLQKRVSSRIESLEDKSFSLIRSNQLWKTFNLTFRILRIFIIVVVIAAFLQYTLGLFPWTSNVASYTLNLFLDPIRTIGLNFLRFLPSLAFLIVIFLVTRYLLKLIKLLFNGINQGAIKLNNFDPDWAMPTFRIIRIFILAFAVIIAYPYIPGSNTSAFKGVSVFLGVLLSLGSSSFIGNLIAGYSMTYRGAFKTGDRIKVDDIVGFVEEQKLLVTRVRSLKNEEIVIPNSVLLNSNIVNYSTKARAKALILHTTVGIGYETPWRQVDAMLKLAADRTEGLLKNPPPFVLQQSLGDFAVTYEINVYCDDANKMPFLYSTLHQNILDVFNENNVQIMTPAYEGDPEIPKVVPKDKWHTPLTGEK